MKLWNYSIFILYFSSIWDSINPNYWAMNGIDGIPNTDITWRHAVLLCFVFLNIPTPPMNLFGVVFPKQWSQKLFAGVCVQILKMKSTDLVYRCFKISSWITLSRVKLLLLNSLLWLLICKFSKTQNSESAYGLRIPLTFVDPTYVWRN